MWRVLGASGKAVWTWPHVIAVDSDLCKFKAGRSDVKPCRDCAAGHDTMTPCARKLATAKSIAETVVEEGGRRDRFDGEAERYGAPERTQSFRVGESGLMPQR